MGIHARFELELGGFRLDAGFTAPGSGVTALFGRSGSGKSTLLRCIAGLEQAPTGRLEVNGEVWQESDRGIFLPAHRRPIGYVFQEPGLFPHLTVQRNLEFGWKRIDRSRRRVAMDQAMELLGLGRLLGRAPGRLSGGERQRVAIARALLTSPELLLMDEPLAALDLASKAEILPYLERLHGELAIPVLYVSHAPDHVVLLQEGRVIHHGGLNEALTRLDLPLARDPEAAAVVEVRVAEHDERYQLTYLDFRGGRFTISRRPLTPGQRLRLRIHAQDVSVTLNRPAETSILNVFPARLREMAPINGSKLLLRLEAGDAILLARITRKSADHLGLRLGQSLFAQTKALAVLD
jgi:molybdate transport system ATP-binding protein